MGTDLGSAPPYQGPQRASYTSVAEANAGKGAEGQAAPPGTIPVAVQPGDTVSALMANAKPPMDWNNPQHREQFLADNPQFTDQHPPMGDKRSADLIYPGEVVYVRDPSVQTPSPVDTSQAVDGTPIRQGPYTDSYGPYMPNTTVELKDGSSILIDDNGYPKNGAVGIACNVDGTYRYQNYQDGKPVGEPYDAMPTSEPSSLAQQTNDAAGAVSPSPVSRSDSTVGDADRAFVDAVKAELEQGTSVDALKARYGNDAWLGGFIDQAASEVAAGR